MFLFFNEIFFSNNILIDFALHPFNICEKYPDLWNFIKISYVVSFNICILIISHLIYSVIFSKQKKNKKNNNNNDLFNTDSNLNSDLNLLVGTDANDNFVYISEKGLYQNILITGTIGSGKTSSAMYPFTRQLIKYKADNKKEKLGLLILDVHFVSDNLINQPTETASLYSTGKLSVKAKAKKDVELERSLFYSGIGFYISSLCYNISANIQRIRLSVTRSNEGLYWVEFNRTKFSKIRAYSLNPTIEILNFPNITKINAAGNLVGIPIIKFSSQIQIQSKMLDLSYATGENVSFTISIEDAKLICRHINNNKELSDLVSKAESLGGNIVVVNKRFENILKEIKNNN